MGHQFNILGPEHNLPPSLTPSPHPTLPPPAHGVGGGGWREGGKLYPGPEILCYTWRFGSSLDEPDSAFWLSGIVLCHWMSVCWGSPSCLGHVPAWESEFVWGMEPGPNLHVEAFKCSPCWSLEKLVTSITIVLSWRCYLLNTSTFQQFYPIRHFNISTAWNHRHSNLQYVSHMMTRSPTCPIPQPHVECWVAQHPQPPHPRPQPSPTSTQGRTANGRCLVGAPVEMLNCWHLQHVELCKCWSVLLN